MGLLACLLAACGGPTSDSPPEPEPAPGSNVVHTPPPNADSLQRVNVQLYYEGEALVLAEVRPPLGGWTIVAQQEMVRTQSGAIGRLRVAERTDTDGLAVFWLDPAQPYTLETANETASPGCSWGRHYDSSVSTSERSELRLGLWLVCS